jgi:UDP-GlcNAc:undecaprenyl-phosphate/decaprenyl-phosphate GlcNAc-1-phosphate transferase
MYFQDYFYIFITALFTALLMVPFLRKWALAVDVVDNPDERKVHSQKIPRLGGVAIFMAFLFSMLVFVEMTQQVRGILAGGLILFCTGLVDDLYGLSAKRKFMGEIAACLLAVIIGNLSITHLGNLLGTGDILLPVWFGIPFTVFAAVGVINALNLIDGLDGLSGGVASIALSAFFVLAWQDGNTIAMMLCAGFFGALLGFLKYNFYPAKIFMGDAGSLSLGFILAFLAIDITQNPGSSVSPIAPLLILGVPIIDTLLVMSRRLLAGTSPFAPDKTHVHHKFLAMGFQHRFTVILIYGLSLFWAIVAVVFNGGVEWALLLVYALLTLLFYCGLRLIRSHKDRFDLFRKDSAASIRETATYQRISGRVERLVPLLLLLVVSYLLLAALCANQVEDGMWQMAGLLLVVGVTLLYQTRDIANHFLLAMLYADILVIEFTLEGANRQEVLQWLTIGNLSDLLFFSVLALALLLGVFRRGNRFYLDSVDYLLLAVTILLSVVFATKDGLRHLSQPFIGAVILFVGIKVVSFFGQRYTLWMVYPVLTVLAIITLRGALGWLV